MREFNMISLRETLEQIPTNQLDAMLRGELEKEPLDEHAVRLILKVLREREADYPIESTEQIDKAWEKYQEKTELKKPNLGIMLLRVASIVIVLGALILILPKEANARNFFDRIAAWTDSIFELFSPSDPGRQKAEYEFKTDHPGLQEVYDTVTELGVTVPVVPMWLDETYECINIEKNESRVAANLTAIFSDGERDVVYRINVLSENISREYPKNESDVDKYESNGIFHNIVQNEELLVAVWTIENIECSLFIDCQEDVLYKILDSIYMMEE